MPWSMEKNHPQCPLDKPFAITQDSNGKVMGCHMTRKEALAQMAALYAGEPMMGAKKKP